MLNVFITVDTEIWPPSLAPGPSNASFRAAFNRDILGRTRTGDVGVPLQLRIMNDFGIRASWFVESLFATYAGIAPLQDITGMITEAGHEVHTHLHPEWWQAVDELRHLYRGRNMHAHSEETQHRMIEIGLANLARAGVERPRAFRAGNYGASFSTLTALHAHGIEFETSYNDCYLNSDCRLQTAAPLLQPVELEGVLEFPVSFFEDWPGHYRHAQLTACSFAELAAALDQACDKGWQSFVIVSHSFELLNPARNAPDRVMRKRLERLCRHIAANSDRMRARCFEDLDAAEFGRSDSSAMLRSNVLRTGLRYGSQLSRRLRSKG